MISFRRSGRKPRPAQLAGVAAVVATLALVGTALGDSPAASAHGASRELNQPQAQAAITAPYGPESAVPLGAPAPLKTASSAYTIALTNQDGSPVTWDPCRPIHYVTREAHAPAEGPQLIKEGIAAASRATGLVFINDGSTTEAPTTKRQSYQYERYGNRPAPVLIAWETPDENPEFADHGKGVEMGYGSNEDFQSADGRYTYTSGQIRLNAPGFRMVIGKEGIDTARGMIEHELGHVLGLEHISDPSQLMNPGVTWGITGYQTGDLAGLSVLGRGKCEPAL